MSDSFFPERPRIDLKIYAYRDTNPQYKGLLKVGQTSQSVEERVRQQYPNLPGPRPYEIVVEEDAVRNDGSSFTDHDVHHALRSRGVQNPKGEWFRCGPEEVRSAIIEVRTGRSILESRHEDFKMRPEQREAVDRAADYFSRTMRKEPGRAPRFLWNAKMRFGKTFAAYQLAKKMGWRRLLVLTFKPAAQRAWKEDLAAHVDFEGWRLAAPEEIEELDAAHGSPLVCFGSFQDMLGRNPSGGIKPKNEAVHAVEWDCVVLDEYHFGSWREKARELLDGETESERRDAQGGGLEYFSEEHMPISAGAYLYMSGTPFRAIASGEFIEEQIYNWTYQDEQRAKEEWKGEGNPYEPLPRMVMLTYEMPEFAKEIARGGEFDEFDLSEFFSAGGEGDEARFKHEDDVQRWLDMIRGSSRERIAGRLAQGDSRPALPFYDANLLSLLTHTFWLLPSVASCFAMRNLLRSKQNVFYHGYGVVVAAGNAAGLGAKALDPVLESMGNPLKSKTITLSCGKLATGVTVRPWTGVFMLRNLTSPETYFQAAFRVQSPWTIQNPDGTAPNRREIVKRECYILDFAPNRALRLVSEYGRRLGDESANPEEQVAEFIKFLPVLAYDGSSMRRIDAKGVLDMTLSGTTATLLARRWESALLVNVDNRTLEAILASEEALRALGKIKGFRALNQEIEKIISHSRHVRDLKTRANERSLSREEKREISDREKGIRKSRQEIQRKLIKFATRIPLFMYLTDYREHTLKDIVTELEPDLFRKVTGLEIRDFELLVSMNVFNSSLMNDAIYKFKRYEDASLSYAGIERHVGPVGLYDTVVTRDEFRGLGAARPEPPAG